MPITDLAFPLLIGAGILVVLASRQQSAVVAPIDISAAPDPTKCQAFEDAKVNSKLVNEPCSQVCSSETGNKEECSACETACGVPNCGCYGTSQIPECSKYGPTAEGCPNQRGGTEPAADTAEDSEDNEDDDNDDNDGGGGGDSTIERLRKRGQANLKRLQEARKTNPTARYASCMNHTPMNWA